MLLLIKLAGSNSSLIEGSDDFSLSLKIFDFCIFCISGMYLMWDLFFYILSLIDCLFKISIDWFINSTDLIVSPYSCLNPIVINTLIVASFATGTGS